jgi:hypothetical protein
MQLDNFFEDLEAQFEYQLDAARSQSTLEDCNLIRVKRLDGRAVELAMPLLGADFVAGMTLGANDFKIFRFSNLAQINFLKLENANLPKIRVMKMSFSAFLGQVPAPFEITWVTSGSPQVNSGMLIDQMGELLLLQVLHSTNVLGVPVTVVEELGIVSVENFGTTF